MADETKETTAEETTEAEVEDTEEVVSEETADEVEVVDTAKLTEELNVANDKFIRLYAEYDNFRKRTAKEKTEIYNDAVAKTVESILPVLDNFQLALKVECADEKFAKGMEMILAQFNKILTDMGVEEIKALGEKFDPNVHHAIKQVDSEEEETDTVCEVFQAGYKLGNRLIRPAMVAVIA